ncbi:MAG: dUTP diphosphatase [Candidatus Omnitrophota bacterium]
MEKIKVRIKRKPGCEDLPLPQYMSEHSSAMDICADVDDEVVIAPGDIKLISAGFYMSLPAGYEAQIRPRSGLAIKHGISIANTPGTIDADYRGLVGIIIINHGKLPFIIKRANRIAQMAIQKVIKAEIDLVEELDETVRSTGGFGHSGI